MDKLTKAKTIFQGTYLFLYIIMGIGISGNIEYGTETPTIILILFSIVTFLTVGKIGYLIKVGKI